MSYTMDPNGNWSKPVQIFSKYHGSDTNFAPLILSNGSLIAMWRTWNARGSRQYLATAPNWKEPETYVQHHTELFPDLGAAGTEDQFLYEDDNGNFHAVFHHMYGTGTKTQWWLDATGGHAFSKDGWSWTYTGVGVGQCNRALQHTRWTRGENPFYGWHNDQIHTARTPTSLFWSKDKFER
eukprot:TRINITY_DN7702_c0_g1_i1.p1 TRINITY_DN7702_c0_g1~~TRINITY_DN7702_c0_g1_i1.p1  ORF type:complete len:181 (+),score=16.68 TRINITY_DN7702_c0_g1_i1:408-950(+)